jgi:hypothetical protein
MQVIRNNGDNTHQYFEKNILKRNTFDLIINKISTIILNLNLKTA